MSSSSSVPGSSSFDSHALRPSVARQTPLEASTWQWLNERTKGHTAQFDVIVKRSARRFEVEEKRGDLARKLEVVDRLLKDLDQSQKQLEEFRGQVRDIERNFAQALAAAQHRIRDNSPAVSTKMLSLTQGLASAREKLQGFEAAARAANEQAQILALDLRTTEAKVRALPPVSVFAFQAVPERDARRRPYLASCNALPCTEPWRIKQNSKSSRCAPAGRNTLNLTLSCALHLPSSERSSVTSTMKVEELRLRTELEAEHRAMVGRGTLSLTEHSTSHQQRTRSRYATRRVNFTMDKPCEFNPGDKSYSAPHAIWFSLLMPGG